VWRHPQPLTATRQTGWRAGHPVTAAGGAITTAAPVGVRTWP
jgi:hypothetical protein